MLPSRCLILASRVLGRYHNFSAAFQVTKKKKNPLPFPPRLNPEQTRLFVFLTEGPKLAFESVQQHFSSAAAETINKSVGNVFWPEAEKCNDDRNTFPAHARCKHTCDSSACPLPPYMARTYTFKVLLQPASMTL